MRDKKKGAVLIIAAIVIVVAVLLFGKTDDDKKKNNNAEKITVMYSEIDTLSFEETTVPETTMHKTEEDSEYICEEEQYGTVKVRAIPEEYLTLLEISEEELKKQLISFANSYGFAMAKEAGSLGTITINTSEDSVYAGFYYYLEDKSYYKFNLVYVRKSKRYEFKPW